MSSEIITKRNSFKIMGKFLFIFPLFFAVFSSNIFGQNAEHSVVQIQAEGKNRGIGVVLKEPDHVVTALHVVAGIPDIRVYSKFKGRSVPATIIRVHKESDLALLKLTTPLNLPALNHTKNPPQAHGKYLIYGYTATPEVIEMPLRLASKTYKLTSIIAPTTPQYKWLVDNGYPSPNATIIRLADPIQHGDSGSPITDTSGNLVGIADGGLPQASQRMNWGISASTYINALWTSNESINVNKSSAKFLKNARSENTEYTSKGGLALYKVFSSSLAEIYETALSEDQELIDEYRQDAKESSEMDIFPAMIDVYEDYNSGASMAIPRGLQFDFDKKNGWLEVWTSDENVEMIIIIKKMNSWKEARKMVDKLESMVIADDDWKYDPEEPDDIEDDPQDYFYSKLISRNQYDEHDEIVGDLLAEILVDNNFIMANAVKVWDYDDADDNPKDWYFSYLMDACIILSGFAID